MCLKRNWDFITDWQLEILIEENSDSAYCILCVNLIKFWCWKNSGWEGKLISKVPGYVCVHKESRLSHASPPELIGCPAIWEWEPELNRPSTVNKVLPSSATDMTGNEHWWKQCKLFCRKCLKDLAKKKLEDIRLHLNWYIKCLCLFLIALFVFVILETHTKGVLCDLVLGLSSKEEIYPPAVWTRVENNLFGSLNSFRLALIGWNLSFLPNIRVEL